MNSNDDTQTLLIGALALLSLTTYEYTKSLGSGAIISILIFIVGAAIASFAIYLRYFTTSGREKNRKQELLQEVPYCLTDPSGKAVALGMESDLGIPLFLPDSIRSRHVHILGATGSGKTESIILNFIRQDAARGLGAIILDAKGDQSFIKFLGDNIPYNRLKIFDLSSSESMSYNPTAEGSPIEAAQRLYSALTWSEQFYAAKARSVLLKLFEAHYKLKNVNPSIADIKNYLETPGSFAKVAVSDSYPAKLAEKDFSDISGLRDQIDSLCVGHLTTTLSPNGEPTIVLSQARKGAILYFRLQSLMSPQIGSTIGKLLINNLNFLAGTAHRGDGHTNDANLIPTYVDEFASFVCPEFADLISKARSAKLALHFSHQSIGDLKKVDEGFLNQITDNSGTKIVMRINDPDSAEYMARAFGTKIYQKVTQRVTNAKEVDNVAIESDGTTREAHQFRAAPDLMKTLPTGVGSVLVAHGFNTPHGASSVFKINFPKLTEEKL